MKLVASILVTVVLPLLLAEFTEVGPWLARRLIYRAARRLPGPERSRWREEWLANLEDMPGKLTKLMWSLSIFLVGAGKMRRILGAPPLSQVLWARVQAAWQRLWSQQKSPQGSSQAIELQVDSVVQKQEVQPVTLTVEAPPVTGTAEALPVTALTSRAMNRKYSPVWVLTMARSSEKEFKQYLVQQKREAEQNLAQQRREFDAWLDLQ
jgi:hypothetical protein